MEKIVVTGSFDNLRSPNVRFLEEAAKFGPVHVFLWSDEVIKTMTGSESRFPFEERKYFLEALRYVYKIHPIGQAHHQDELPIFDGFEPRRWVVSEENDTPHKQTYCFSKGIVYSIIEDDNLIGFPIQPVNQAHSSQKKKILVTGCYDWFHSGHVRFFEETAALGDLFVVVGHDENVRLLKGEGHPMFSEDERRYMVGSIKFVKHALISSGTGWMDAEPEIEAIRPDIYAVNEDGDNPEKRDFCRKLGLEYAVLKRTPAAGLPRRESTYLRGF